MNDNLSGIGFKIILAIGAGVAVFLGIGGFRKIKENQSNNQRETQKNNINEEQDVISNTQNSSENCQKNPSRESSIIKDLRATQDVCGKVFGIVQSLGSLAENISVLFNNTNTAVQRDYYYQSSCGGPWCNVNDQRSYYNGPITWRRRSDFIVEGVPTCDLNYGNGNNQYPI